MSKKKIQKNCVICEKLSLRSLQPGKKNNEKKKSAKKANGGQILLLTQRLSNIG
jgi:hypothetical protein